MSSGGGSGAGEEPGDQPGGQEASGAGEQGPRAGAASSESTMAGLGAAGALAGGPIPASLLGPGMALSAALGEAGVGDGEEADMGRLQVTPCMTLKTYPLSQVIQLSYYESL